eukprot:m.270694 g.270694  ORF g.270694 m.270694 type:complete len:714 (-) comp91065_c0_seq1:571-2712(-)
MEHPTPQPKTEAHGKPAEHRMRSKSLGERPTKLSPLPKRQFWSSFLSPRRASVIDEGCVQDDTIFEQQTKQVEETQHDPSLVPFRAHGFGQGVLTLSATGIVRGYLSRSTEDGVEDSEPGLGSSIELHTLLNYTEYKNELIELADIQMITADFEQRTQRDLANELAESMMTTVMCEVKASFGESIETQAPTSPQQTTSASQTLLSATPPTPTTPPSSSSLSSPTTPTEASTEIVDTLCPLAESNDEIQTIVSETANVRASADSPSDHGRQRLGGMLRRLSIKDKSETDVWGELIANWDPCVRKRSRLVTEMVRRGIPSQHRSTLWTHSASCSSTQVSEEDFNNLWQAESIHELQIERDLDRTFPCHDLFKDAEGAGQKSLLRVVKAVSVQNDEIGYCQGFTFIAGVLLMHLSEVNAFRVFGSLLNDFGLGSLFCPTMADLPLRLHQFDGIFKDLFPQLHAHFDSQSILTSSFASKWFLTLFATVLPLPCVFRFFDILLLGTLDQGVVEIFRAGCAILEGNHDHLLSCEFEEILDFFTKNSMNERYDGKENDFVSSLVKFNSSVTVKKLEKLEKGYEEELQNSQSELIIELRTKNSTLQHSNRAFRAQVGDLQRQLQQAQEEIKRLSQKSAETTTQTTQTAAHHSLQYHTNPIVTNNFNTIINTNLNANTNPNPNINTSSSVKIDCKPTEQFQRNLPLIPEVLHQQRHRRMKSG